MEANNTKVIRETLDNIIGIAKVALNVNAFGNSNNSELWEIIDKCKSALSEPPRNCDVGTPAEQSRRFREFCHLIRTRRCDCSDDCPLIDEPDIIHCAFSWAQMTYEASIPNDPTCTYGECREKVKEFMKKRIENAPPCETVADDKPPMAFNKTDDIELMDNLSDLTPLELEMYKVIDDIDTYSDMAKDNLKLYQNLVIKRIEEFHNNKFVVSDGYKVGKTNKTDEKGE